MLKFKDNPPVLSPLVKSIHELQGPWWVAHTKARAEKAAAHQLVKAEIGYFLPMVERVTISGGRKRRGMQPLFTSYFFFAGDANARYAALATNQLCQVIAVTDQERFVAELSDIERALTSGISIDQYAFAAIGNKCRVRSGPLQGVTGTVIRRDNHTRLVLMVSMLGKGASLEIDADLLEPAE